MAITFIGYDEKQKKKATCRHCGAMHEYMPNDVRDRNHTDYGGGSEIAKYIICTQCSKEIHT